ncbi:HAD family hydrolase [Pseudoteredinibacter isoporae]|uniref:Phosphoglycolate phosphatase n=1 Tax=Pseudoteredinibacter isoporae TaxID=570281 RepID=A0A7X0JVD8_9GAMM|nr:HAD-IA family hydrolase [Pseudoteredinibacter isoporae]MBB6522972.1 phosphoglycolate phosphatase [Pseudoteredinibacter isoporae]NHO88496.1 HAD-IA family hydrolase [Pseudoteredinibacter isoporae]NIB22105.1 HAD-IA family hydrolase [Pseudoteredinibacter isoporae]
MLVIFDCDGVIVDSEIIAAQVFAEHLQGLDLNVTPEECFARFKGYSMKTCMKELVEMLGGPIPEHFLRGMQAETFARFESELKAISGIEHAISGVERDGWRTCIASGGSHSKMRVTLGKVGLWEHFEGRIYSAVDVVNGKPAPDIFLYAAEQEAVAPERCVVIEDSQAGVEAALAAEMPVFFYDPQEEGLRDKALLAHDRVYPFCQMAQLPALLKMM